MTESTRPYAIIGAGPVGSILAAALAQVDQPVVMVEISEKRRLQVQQHGLRVTGRDTMEAKPPTMLSSVDDLVSQQPSAVFISTKTWTLKNLLPALQKALPADALVVSFQNGIGPEDDLARSFPGENVARAIVNFAGGVDPDNGTTTMSFFNPPNFLGPFRDGRDARLARLSEQLTTAGLTTQTSTSEETRKLAFFKTILNSSLNALCSTNGITMRAAMTYCHTRNMARLLVREGLTVASAVGYSYGEDALEKCMKYLDGGGDHMPSMWNDLQAGSPTEIEYMNGKIVKYGLMFKNLNIDANILFTALVITQEIKSGSRASDDIPIYLRHF